MTDEDMFYPSGLFTKSIKLHLGALTTINENVLVINVKQLGCLVPVMCWNGRITAKDFENKCQEMKTLFLNQNFGFLFKFQKPL